MKKLSSLFRIVFFISFGLLGISFCMHVLGYKANFLAEIGIIILLLSPVLTALFAAYSFAQKGNTKAVILSFLLIIVLILNALIS